MTNQKYRIVENYVLESIKYVNPDQSEVWTARHKILKKNYMLKKVKYIKSAFQRGSHLESDDYINSLNYQKIIREIELLKQFKTDKVPKCQKMIKTTNNIYVVYDEFVGTSLNEFFKLNKNSQVEVLKVMINTVKMLQFFHQQELIFLQLSPDTIFLNNQQVFFSEWSLAIYQNNSEGNFPVKNNNQSWFIANEVTFESKCSPASDIYSLGKIFQFITECSNYNNHTEKLKEANIKSIISQMSNEKPQKRPFLNQIITKLQKILLNEYQNMQIMSSRRLIKRKSDIPQVLLVIQRQKSNPSLIRPKEKDLVNCKSVNNINSSRAFRGSKIKSTDEQIIIKINKTRNLSFFINDLSQFVLKSKFGKQLSYILMKKSLIIINNCRNELNNEELFGKKWQKLKNILKDQITQLTFSFKILKQYLLSQRCQFQLKNQLRNDTEVNEKYLKQKIAVFCEQEIAEIGKIVKDKETINYNNLEEDLFFIYMVTKQIEEGSFEKFWQKIYSAQYAFLKNQKYFHYQKKYGYRYIKSKIAQILNKR